MKRTQKRRVPTRCDQSDSKICSEPVQHRLPVPFFAVHSGSTASAGERRLPANSAQHKIPLVHNKYPGEKGGYAIIVMRADMGESILNIPEVVSKEDHDLK